jgi:predicted Fe-Mo cluster-binding NifX family protein
MPIYEYQGKQYDVATDDPSAAKAKILSYLGTQEASPVPAPAAAAPKFAPPAPVVAKEPEPPKRAPYKNRVEMLDDAVNLLEEGADQTKLKQSLENIGVKFEDVIKHGQQRGSAYFKQQAPMPPETFRQGKENVAYTGTVKATPETKFTESPVKYAAEATGNMFKRVDASLGDIATSYLFQTGVTDADAAGRLLARNAKQRAAAAPSQDIRAGMMEIGNSETYGEAISALASNPRATFTMLVESLAVSLPGMVPSLVLGPAGVVARSTAAGLSSGGIEYGSVMADVLQDKGVNMLDANAVSKALSDPKIMDEIKEKGAKRGLIIGAFDALSMGMAGRFLKPAQALIAEGKLAGAAAKKATMAAWGKELALQMGGGAGGELAAQKATGENKPADVLLEAVAEGVTAPIEARSNLRDAKMAEQQATINAELAAEKKEETPAVTPEKVRADRIDALTKVYIQQGIPAENAGNIAARKVDAELKAEAKTAAIKIPAGRVEQLTQELIASGVPPQQAQIDAQKLAQEEAQADELAQTETGGVANVAEPISKPIGTSTELAEQPSPESTAGGTAGVDTSGVVSTRQDVTGTDTGERVEPFALTRGNVTPEAIQALSDEQLEKELSNVYLSDNEFELLDEEQIRRKEASAPAKPAEATPEKATTLYHGTNTQYDTLDPEKSGGMVFFGEDLSTAQRYAQNGGGGRARIDNSQKYIVTDRGVVYELDGETWKAVGVAPEEGLINQDTIQPLDKAYPSLSQAEAEEMTNPDSGTAGVVPKTSRIITQDFSGLKLLDISTPEGRDVIAGLTPTTRVGSDLVDAAKFDARDKTDPDSTTQLNSGFWGITKFSSTYGDQLKKDIIGPLKALGYDGIRFSDDQHSSVGLFDTGLGKTKSSTKTKGTTGGIETSETIETTQEGQEAPPAGAVSKGKRGRPPVQQRHVVTENSEGGFDHVTDGEVTATYKNKKQAIAAVNLARSKDKGDAALIAKNQEKLDKALASTGRGRPPKAPSEEGGNELSREDKVELDALESALETYNSTTNDTSVLNSAMYIYEVANDKTAPDAVRERAQQMLEDDVDPKDVKRALRSSDIKVAKPDTGFSKLTNGSQAIAHIIKTGNLFQRFVAQRIRNFVIGVKFVVVEKGDPAPAQLSGARGLFVYTPGSKERTIYVRGSSFGDQQGINVITVLHELLHAATASRIEAGLLKGFKNASLQKFMREMESLMKRTQEAYEEGVLFGELSPEVQEMIEGTTDRDRTGKVSIGVFSDPHEFLAYGMSSPEFQKFLMSVQGKRGTGFSGFVDSIRDLFGVKAGDATAFTDLVDITDKMLGTRLTKVDTKGGALQQKGKFTPPEFDEEADLKAKRSALQLAKDVKIAKEKVRLSREGEESKNVSLMQTARDPKAVRQILANAVDDMGYIKLQASVRLPTFDFLAKWAADVGIPALSETNTQLQRMLGMSQQFLAGAEQVIGSLNRGFKEDPKLSREKFSDFVYATTLAEVDPSDPNAREVEVERKEKKTKKGAKPAPKTTTLAADYKALGSVGQRMYKQLRDYYESVIELYSDLLDEQINSIQGMAPEEKKNLMALIRKTFEADARIKPFFPLVRRGDYWLAIGSGENRLFYLFESRAERNAKAKELAARRGEDYEDALFRQEFVQGNDLKTLRAASQNSSEMLKKIFEAIDAKDLGSPAAKEGLKDAVYQIYLTTMPEQSFRRQFTHRKGRGGFSTDLQRNIATTASKQSIQLARLKYAPKLRLSLSAARDSINEREELSPFVQEAEKRIDMALSGDHGSLSESVAGIANKASYFWYLSSAASALIQPSSVFISGLPVLAGNYNNATGAATELAKMTTLVNQYSVFRTNADGTTSITAPSIANSKSIPEDERKAVSEMTARGVSESTYASLVWGYKSMSTEQFEGIKGKGKRIANLMVGALMHNTERLSREAVYLAAYRLGKKQGLSYDDAVQKAVDSTNEALGNYDITNRPRFMQQGIGKIAFQFKTYPLQMSLLLLTNFKKMLPFLNKEGKKEAATKFFGMMGTSFLLAGAANMALFSPIMGLVGWAWGQLELDDDWPEELKGLDFETWFRTVFLPEKLGDVTIGGVPVSDIVDRGPLNAITGYDIGSRIGLNDLWGRDSKETKTSRESAIAFMLDHFGGPTASLMLGFADAYDAYALGDYQKMLEKMLPAAVRNLVIANKYADEGMKTPRGKELVSKDDVKKGELLGQAIGFRPDILAATQGPAFKLTGIEQRIVNQRNMILNKLDFQLRKDTDKSTEEFNNILENEVIKFNIKHPTYKLDGASIRNSLREKAKQRESSRAGVAVTKKNIGLVEEAVNTLEDRLDKRAEEMAARRKAEKNPQ